MQTATHRPEVINPARLAALERKAPAFVSLDAETRSAVDTATAAYHLNRQPQTLRGWAMRDGTGPIRCFRINGRLAWPVAELRRVLGIQT